MGILSINRLAKSKSKSFSSNFWYACRRTLSPATPFRKVQTYVVRLDSDLKHNNKLKNDNQNHHLKLLVRNFPDRIRFLTLLSTENFSPKDDLCCPFAEFSDDFSYVVTCSCNGLFYMDDMKRVALVWNPTTNECISLPPSSVQPKPWATGRSYPYCCGFGFDHKSDDYKVIRFLSSVYEDGSSRREQVELYSLKNDSWKEISHPAEGFPRVDLRSVYANGFYYWRAFSRESIEHILSFDFATEKFSFIPFPETETGKIRGPYILDIVEFNGSLAALVYPNMLDGDDPDIDYPEEFHEPNSVSETGTMPFDVWVWNDESWSWSRLCFIQVPGVTTRPLGLCKNDKFFLEGLDGELILFDGATQQLKNLGVCADRGSPMELFPYVERSFPLHGKSERKKGNKEV